MHDDLLDHIARVQHSMRAIRAHFSQETTFTQLSQAVPVLRQLEECMGLKRELDTLIAFLADKRNAGCLARSSRAADFIAELYDISRWKAQQRINEANDIYGPPVPPQQEAEPESSNGAASATDEDARSEREEEQTKRRQKEEQRRQERIKREREAHNRLKEKLSESPLPEEKQQAITQELNRLQPEAPIGKKELYAQAVEQARRRNVRDLRQWLRHKIDRANGSAHNPLTLHNLRSLNIHPTDANGGARFSGYASPAMLALFDAILKPARRPAHDPELRNDHRTATQRRADALITAMREFSAGEAGRNHGVTSIVVSMTVDDVKELADSDEFNAAAMRRFATNTSASLSAFDIMLLGAGPLGYTTLLTRKGQALSAAKFRRSATLEQRIALIASELVCSHPGCDQPAINCEVHHIRPWAQGGETKLSNLTLLCRGHHMQNNDSRSPRDPREYAERDPESGRVGKKAPATRETPDPPIRFNDSMAAEASAGARIRRKYQNAGAGEGTPTSTTAGAEATERTCAAPRAETADPSTRAGTGAAATATPTTTGSCSDDWEEIEKSLIPDGDLRAPRAASDCPGRPEAAARHHDTQRSPRLNPAGDSARHRPDGRNHDSAWPQVDEQTGLFSVGESSGNPFTGDPRDPANSAGRTEDFDDPSFGWPA